MNTENKLDLKEILKGCEGIKLWNDVFGEVTLTGIDDERNLIIFKTTMGDRYSSTSEGRHLISYEGNCVLWPSRDCRDWSKFQKPIELRVGKTYLTRDGKIAKILFYDEKDKGDYIFLGVREENDQWVPTWWAKSGKYFVGDIVWALDLVKEIAL